MIWWKSKCKIWWTKCTSIIQMLTSYFMNGIISFEILQWYVNWWIGLLKKRINQSNYKIKNHIQHRDREVMECRTLSLMKAIVNETTIMLFNLIYSIKCSQFNHFDCVRIGWQIVNNNPIWFGFYKEIPSWNSIKSLFDYCFRSK